MNNKLAWVFGEIEFTAVEAMAPGKFYNVEGDPVFVDGVQSYAIGDRGKGCTHGTFRCNCVNTDAYTAKSTPVFYKASDNTCYPAAGTGRIWIGTAAKDKANGGGTELLVELGGRPTLQNAAGESLTDADAASLDTFLTKWTTTGAAAGTLADGYYVGQLKKIQLIVDAGDLTLTPANLSGGDTITFADAGDFALLQWDGTNWVEVELGNDADGATAPAVA